MRIAASARTARRFATLVILVVGTAGMASTSARAPAVQSIAPLALASPQARAVPADSLSADIRRRLAGKTPQGDYSPADWKRVQ